MLFDYFSNMCSQNRYRINNGIAIELRLFTLVIRDPQGRQTKSRLNRLNPWHLLEHSTRIHRQIMVQHELTFGNLYAFKFDNIGIRLDLYVVPDTDCRHNQPQFQCTLPPDHDNTIQQIAPLTSINKRDQ